MHQKLRRYFVVSEDDAVWGTYLDKDDAEEWAQIANLGGCVKRGWKGKVFRVVYEDYDFVQHEETWYY